MCSGVGGASGGVMRWLSGDDSLDMWRISGSSDGSVLPLTQTIPGDAGTQSIDRWESCESHIMTDLDSGTFQSNLVHSAE
jgi:hypothetical protein